MKIWGICTLLCLTIPMCSTAAFADKAWTEVRSPHFRVLTDGSPSDARHVAREFEQMRYVFATEFPQFRLESGAPLTIFAAGDEQTAKALEPMMRKMKGGQLAGIFHEGWEKEYVMVRLDIPAELTTNQVVFHEYTHSIMHLNTHWLPTWLDEGMAEFYGNTRFESDKMYIGAPTPRVYALRGTPIPVEDLMTPSKVRSFYQDPVKTDMFYAESWALVHYLTFGPNMGLGQKLNQFFGQIQAGKPQKEAFQQVFGSFAKVDQGLDEYMRLFAFHAAAIKNPPNIDEKAFTAKKLTMVQTYAEIAGYHLWTHNLKDAQPLVDKALKEDSKLGLALEEQGFLLFAAGEDGAASAAFSQAYAQDPTLYLSLFAMTMLSPAATLDTAADQHTFNDAIMKVADINLQFAPAYVQMARLAVRQGNLPGAYSLSRRAEELEPWRAGYHLMTGEILLRMGKGAEAAGYAEYVSKHWQGPDHDEAVSLWNRVPAKERPAGGAMVDEVPSNTETVDGIVQSVTCGGSDANGKKHPFILTMSDDTKPLTFNANGPFDFGFADTLWWGEDHASACRHLQGLRAVVRYRPSSNPAYAGELVEISVLDPLPESAGSKGRATQTTGQ